MAINSINFIVFVAIVCILYFMIPKRFKWIVLLIASYIYYWLCSKILIIYMLITTISIYVLTLRLGDIDSENKELCKKEQSKEIKKQLKHKAKIRKKWLVFIAIVINFGILISLKYCNFIFGNLNYIFNLIKIPIQVPFRQIILPLGISYYTLQSISYVVDVYRGKYLPDKNFGKIALFVSFFPQMVEGPIGRYDELADQLYEPHKFDYENVKFGIQLMLWGYFKKMVVADRAALYVNEVFGHYLNYTGIPLFFAAMLYTLQIYAEFSGCIDIVRGTAQILGINMAENFKRPFFSKSVQEFWRRWHITLGTWFKEYIFYPISFSSLIVKISNVAKNIFKTSYITKLIPAIFALFFVWLGNGIWHGASYKYIFYGLYYYIIMVIGMVFKPLGGKILKILKLDEKAFSYKLWQVIRTTILVIFGMLIFRANSLRIAWDIFKNIFTITNIDLLFNGKIFNIGFTYSDFYILIICFIIMLVVSILKEKGYNIRKKISEQNLPFRWILYYSIIFAIIIFGIYGHGYVASDFIYGQF